jgi:hypothetical protein
VTLPAHNEGPDDLARGIDAGRSGGSGSARGIVERGEIRQLSLARIAYTSKQAEGLVAMGGIFISYRRDYGHAAGRLYDGLLQRFSRDQIFLDVDNIEPGQTFANAIQERGRGIRRNDSRDWS